MYVQFPNLNLPYYFLSILLSIFLLLNLIIPYASSLTFNFTSFDPNDKSITYEGSANPASSAIQLTINQQGKLMKGSIGRATYYQPIQLWDKTTRNLTDFTSHFTFVINSLNRNKYGDGIAFFLAPAGSKMPNATKGGSMGLTLDNQLLSSTDNPFVAVEFDIYQNNWDPPHEHAGININSMRSVANVTWLADIKEGKVNEAWISYNAKSLNLSVVFTGFNNETSTIVQQHLSAIVDLRLYLPELVTLGFSAATGNATAIHTLSSWSFNSSLDFEAQKDERKTGMIIGLSVGGGVLICVLGLACFVTWKLRRNKGTWTYDVFLNFRGVDTRNSFTGNLYNSLDQGGIRTFIDDEEIRKGEEITPALLQAIKESRIFIAVFSNNYASSTFCLDELVMILECSKAQGRLFLPVFYDVDPSQVRHQNGAYGEALAKHEERFRDDKNKVQKWRDALRQAANVSGWYFQFQHGSESEYKFIGKIVQEVCVKINRVHLHVANNPVGMESRVLDVTSLLGLGSDEIERDVNMVGIYGIGGIGKSTIARAVHNLIADQFEGVCFLADIREKAIHHGLAHLQETLLHEILGEKDMKVGDVYRGISIIKKRLHRKKVLLILDNVDKKKQLQVLAGGYDWFGFGSKILITTRDKHLLTTHGIVKLYEVKQLKDENALELFSWHAFKNKRIDPRYVDIANRAVFAAHGLPLALEVIGSHLCGKSLDVWKSALDKYERIIHKDIHDILKVSYDDLEEDEKGIFLDIACFFNSYEMSYVKEILYLHGFHAEDGIQVLTDKSLIKIDGKGYVRMHDLIQDMGREIVRQESTLEPGRRSRLWFREDIVHVLEENTGTDTVEVIIVDLCKDREVQWNGGAFGQMKNLRILIIGNARFSRGPQTLPNSLRVLDWSEYPSSFLPSDFNPKNLVILNLPESCLKWFKTLKVFETLSFLNFEGCKFLTELPSLSRVPNLMALCLDYCTNLMSIHGSVGFLERLVLLSAQGCTELEILVPCINLPSLETIDLRDCSSLVSFPEVLGVMENIRDVYLDRTAIYKLPDSIRNLVGLQRLFVRECQRMVQLPGSIHILPKLEITIDYGCRGFRLSEDEEKVSPKVFPNAMLVSNNGVESLLDVCLLNICPNNVIEVCSPSSSFASRYFPFVLGKGSGEGRKHWFKFTSWESRKCFWFRKEFPQITLCWSIVPDNMVFLFKFSVLINGTKQFTSSSFNYIFSRERVTEQILSCDLVCKVESAFLDNEWNEVEILCELKYPMPCDFERVMPTKIRWSHIHVNSFFNFGLGRLEGSRAISKAGPPKLELQMGRKWVVENQIEQKSLVIEECDAEQSVYVYGCKNCVLQIQGKVYMITIDNCIKMGVVFKGVVEACVIVNSNGVEVQCQGSAPAILVNNTSGCQLYLSKDCLETSISTSKSREINVLVPGDEPDGEWIMRVPLC